LGWISVVVSFAQLFLGIGGQASLATKLTHPRTLAQGRQLGFAWIEIGDEIVGFRQHLQSFEAPVAIPTPPRRTEDTIGDRVHAIDVRTR
jgi:hypothetical protein